jgi:hypothetical protein
MIFGGLIFQQHIFHRYGHTFSQSLRADDAKVVATLLIKEKSKIPSHPMKEAAT